MYPKEWTQKKRKKPLKVDRARVIVYNKTRRKSTMGIKRRKKCPERGFQMVRPHNTFTEEQIEQLRGSRYVRSVGAMFVFFTEEFKRIYWQMYTEENLMPNEILRRLGIEYHVLGTARVRGFTYNMKKRHERQGDVCGGRGVEKPKERVRQTAEQKLERLRAENEYLKQELEFVKKIISAGGEVKR
jgi:hypothetical protein